MTLCIKSVVLKRTVWIFKHKTKSLNQTFIDIHGKGGGVKVTVEVVAIFVASRKRATSIRNGRIGVAGAEIASSRNARARMMRTARAKTSARARATASAFPPPNKLLFELVHGSKSGCCCDIIILNN